jgi:osmotically inducible protein OsmC
MLRAQFILLQPKPIRTIMQKRKGSAIWKGGLKDGKGTVSTESGVLSSVPYSFENRFENVKGSNPEELIGAAHASCFSMALSMILGEAGIKGATIATTATVSLNKVSDGFAITDIHLDVEVTAPGADEAAVLDCAAKAKAGCPVSKLFKANITMDAKLTA